MRFGVRVANSIEFYSSSSSSSTYFSKYKFNFDFSKNKLFRVQVRDQADEYPKSRQLFHRRCSCNLKEKNIRRSQWHKQINDMQLFFW